MLHCQKCVQYRVSIATALQGRALKPLARTRQLSFLNQRHTQQLFPWKSKHGIEQFKTFIGVSLMDSVHHFIDFQNKQKF